MNSNVILVENHLLYQIQWKPSTKIRKISYVALVENYLRLHIKTLHEGHKHFKCDLRGHIKAIHECHKDYKCGSCEKLITGATSLRIHIKTIHEDHKDFDLIGTKALAKDIKCHFFFVTDCYLIFLL